MRLVMIVLTLNAIAADWSQFLGPQRDGSTTEKFAPWTEPPKVLWKASVGDAHSSPVLYKGVVYAFFQLKGSDSETDREALAAFDAATGEKKWEKSYSRPAFTPPFGKGPRSTPACHQDRVFTLGNTGLLTAWNATDGAILWTVDTLEKFQAKNLFFGISTSPTVIDETVIIMVGGKDAGIVGFDVRDGSVKWKQGNDPSSYASPAIRDESGKKVLCFLTGSHLRSLTADGEPRWQFPFKDLLNESSTNPLLTRDICIGSSVTAGSIALRITRDSAVKIWENKDLTCYFSTPVVVDEFLYMINGAATLTNPSVTLRCVELLSGKIAWERKKVGRYHAALIRTGDNKLLMLDDNGFLTLLEANPKAYSELARSKVCGPTWASPAVGSGKLFLRDDKELICLEPNPKSQP